MVKGDCGTGRGECQSVEGLSEARRPVSRKATPVQRKPRGHSTIVFAFVMGRGLEMSANLAKFPLDKQITI
jgi:hypothetical protein